MDIHHILYFVVGGAIGFGLGYYFTKQGAIGKIQGVADSAISGAGLDPKTGLGKTLSDYANGAITGNSSWK